MLVKHFLRRFYRIDQIIYLMYVIDAVGFNAEVYRLKFGRFCVAVMQRYLH